eukprot:m.31741 g.31741  ORF g.31741 m.31741 type:complete len:189 (+) comp5396_c0_seq2:31-597(+)
MSRRLRRLGLEEHVVAALAVRKLQTAADVFGRTELELLETTGLARSEVAQIRDKAAAVLAGRSRTAWDLWIARQKAASKLPTTLPALDAALRGGLICGTITEVAGPCGCGKTQFCTMMSILVLRYHPAAGRGFAAPDMPGPDRRRFHQSSAAPAAQYSTSTLRAPLVHRGCSRWRRRAFRTTLRMQHA